MRGYIGNTDFDWYSRLSAIEGIDEVNSWQPSGARDFHAIGPGQPFLFKLKSPRADYGNGRAYEALEGRVIQVPDAPADQPDCELLDGHARNRFVA